MMTFYSKLFEVEILIFTCPCTAYTCHGRKCRGAARYKRRRNADNFLSDERALRQRSSASQFI